MRRGTGIPQLRHFRGDVSAALNKLVTAGRLASFRTNLYGPEGTDQLEVHVVPVPGQGSGVETAIQQALAPIAGRVKAITVIVVS